MLIRGSLIRIFAKGVFYLRITLDNLEERRRGSIAIICLLTY